MIVPSRPAACRTVSSSMPAANSRATSGDRTRPTTVTATSASVMTRSTALAAATIPSRPARKRTATNVGTSTACRAPAANNSKSTLGTVLFAS
jgi:hypothetical protein